MFEKGKERNKEKKSGELLAGVDRRGQKILGEDAIDSLEKIDELKKQYLELPNLGYDVNLGEIGIRVYKSYLPVISKRYLPVNNCADNYIGKNGIVYFTIKKWVQDTEEKSLDKLINVYQVLSKEKCRVALIYDRDNVKCTVTLAIAHEETKDRMKSTELARAVEGALKGNFPGVEIVHGGRTPWTGIDIPECLNNYQNDGKISVASISTIPSEKSEDFISQSMEKLLDGNVPEEGVRYTIVLLASPCENQDEKKLELCDMYSSIAHLAEYETNQSTNEARTLSKNLSYSETSGASGGWNLLLVNQADNFGLQYSKSIGDSLQLGTTKGETRTQVNYAVKHTLENIEMQIKRMEESSALGLWDFSAYVISNDLTYTKNVAYSYLSLTQGSESYLGKAAVNVWDYQKKDEVDQILASLKRLRHPLYSLKCDCSDLAISDGDLNELDERDWLMYPSEVDTTLSLSGKELAYALNFPRKSVSGLPVLETVAFGREVQHSDSVDEQGRKIDIGQVMHMRNLEPQRVSLDVNSLSLHTFITGSTGAGKTNAILNILNKVQKEGVKFLVIEPAKGEYKYNIGGDCTVYGTNPRFNKLLRINPFSFPENIHVLEHIDRLVEILNACWPMYAAMPAVLKDAIERTYVDLGWDLDGDNYLPDRFPTFADLLRTLPIVMDESGYSNDTKSDYSGALVTRVKSLTNGINGKVLCSKDEISIQNLFDENVIIDLSRVSATETKALIMGIMIMKLQEYKINAGNSAFSEDLKHLTVLEEAHNLLRRTSIEQFQEGANLQGKSVEMITNSIAEMRAYGEGFVIVDQAPCLLDEAAIRNTNTKIVLRLPEQDDREMVGKSEALTDAQIDELAKLPMGVAAVYQNDWVEAVLCKFDKFMDKKEFVKEEAYTTEKKQTSEAVEKFLKCIYLNEEADYTAEEVDSIKNWIETIKRGDYTKRIMRKALNKGLSDTSKKELAYNLFEGKKIGKILMDAYDETEGVDKASSHISELFSLENPELIGAICNYVIETIETESNDMEFIERYGRNKRW